MSSRYLRYISMGCLNMSLLMIDRQNDPVFSYNICYYGTKRFDQDIRAELIKFLASIFNICDPADRKDFH